MFNRALPASIISMATGGLLGFMCITAINSPRIGETAGWAIWVVFAAARIFSAMVSFRTNRKGTGFDMARLTLHYIAATLTVFLMDKRMPLQGVGLFLLANVALATMFAFAIPAGAKVGEPEAAAEEAEESK